MCRKSDITSSYYIVVKPYHTARVPPFLWANKKPRTAWLAVGATLKQGCIGNATQCGPDG